MKKIEIPEGKEVQSVTDIKELNIPNVCFSIVDQLDKEDERQETFKKQRLERGFDDTEIWTLDISATSPRRACANGGQRGDACGVGQPITSCRRTRPGGRRGSLRPRRGHSVTRPPCE